MQIDRTKIPGVMIGVLAEFIPDAMTAAEIDILFLLAGAPDPGPGGYKREKVVTWLMKTNEAEDTRPLEVLGHIVGHFMEIDISLLNNPVRVEFAESCISRIEKGLGRCGLLYIGPDKVAVIGVSTTTTSLADLVKGRDYVSLEEEFARALENVEDDPRESLSAACNILESLFKIIIEDEKLDSPKKQDLPSLWKVIRTFFGFDSSVLEDTDLATIARGLATVVDGIGALRTHASRAHGKGRVRYKVEARHARLAVNSASTVATFTIECWDRRNQSGSGGN